MFLGLTKKEKEALEFVEFPNELRVNLTRLLRASSNAFNSSDAYLVNQNRIVCIAHNILNREQYELVSADGEYYYPSEYGWHCSQLELIFHRGKTYQSIEILADLISESLVDKHDVNKLFQRYDVPVEYSLSSNNDLTVTIADIEPFDEDDGAATGKSTNIRLLVARMDSAVEANDPTSALHNSAAALETLAKEVLDQPQLDDQTLGSFFDKYKKESLLPDEVVDYILTIYKKRNTEPLAAHGSRNEPTIQLTEAIVLVELTKAFIKMEWQFQRPFPLQRSAINA